MFLCLLKLNIVKSNVKNELIGTKTEEGKPPANHQTGHHTTVKGSTSHHEHIHILTSEQRPYARACNATTHTHAPTASRRRRRASPFQQSVYTSESQLATVLSPTPLSLTRTDSASTTKYIHDRIRSIAYITQALNIILQ